MSVLPNTVRVFALLAASYPEPIDPRDLCKRLAMPRKHMDLALLKCLQSGQVRRVAPMRAARGYAYTVAA
jgi:hypothetical protein